MRYFFHLNEDDESVDEVGVAFASDTAAIEHARMEARTLAAESVLEGRLNLTHHVRVTDASGSDLFQVTIGEVITITG